MRSRPPLSVRSATKSQLHTWLSRSARVGITPVERPRLRGLGNQRLTRKPRSRRMRRISSAPPASLRSATSSSACASPAGDTSAIVSRCDHTTAWSPPWVPASDTFHWIVPVQDIGTPPAANTALGTPPAPSPGACAEGSPLFCVHLLQHPNLQ